MTDEMMSLKGLLGKTPDADLLHDSPTLATSLRSLVMVRGGKAFPMGLGRNLLGAGDCAFLERFLDATKANLFFARGQQVVEVVRDAAVRWLTATILWLWRSCASSTR